MGNEIYKLYVLCGICVLFFIERMLKIVDQLGIKGLGSLHSNFSPRWGRIALISFFLKSGQDTFYHFDSKKMNGPGNYNTVTLDDSQSRDPWRRLFPPRFIFSVSNSVLIKSSFGSARWRGNLLVFLNIERYTQSVFMKLISGFFHSVPYVSNSFLKRIWSHAFLMQPEVRSNVIHYSLNISRNLHISSKNDHQKTDMHTFFFYMPFSKIPKKYCLTIYASNLSWCHGSIELQRLKLQSKRSGR